MHRLRFQQEIAEFPLIMITTILPYLIMSSNLAFIRGRYNRIVEILDFYRDQYAESDGLLNHLDKGCVVGWPRSFRDGYNVDIEEGKICTEKHTVINAYFIGAVKALNRIANRLGLPSYRNDVQELQNAFCNAFYDETQHLFRDNLHSKHISLPANVLLLSTDLFRTNRAVKRFSIFRLIPHFFCVSLRRTW